MSNIIGQSLGRYHILEKLGEGGMATVYKAYDTRLERHVALKVITPSRGHSEKFLRRFDREAKILAKLSHPNIVGVIDSGEENGLPFLVLEYIPGGTLKQKLSGEPIPWREAARILLPIAQALEYAHQQGIIHRDVKPSNILLTESDVPMLSDFGIAKMLEADETLELTGTGVGVGTPDYMAPEQGLGRKVDQRADIYSLGIIYYEMLTGRKPYQADTPLAVMMKQANEPLPNPRQYVLDLPSDVEAVLSKSLAKEPRYRFQEMGEFANNLKMITQGVKIKKNIFTKLSGRRIGLFGLSLLFFLSLLWIGEVTNPISKFVSITEKTTITTTPESTLTSTPKKQPTLTPSATFPPQEQDLINHAEYYSAIVEAPDGVFPDVVFFVDAGNINSDGTASVIPPVNIKEYIIAVSINGLNANSGIVFSAPPGFGLSSIPVETIQSGNIYSVPIPAPAIPGVYTIKDKENIWKF